MSEETQDAEAAAPAEPILKSHRVVVEGEYLAKPYERSENGGAAERRTVKYREEFILAPSEHRTHGQGALGHILSDAHLRERLSKKDPDFRAIKTHAVVEHENLHEDKPADKKQADEAEDAE